MMKLDGVRLDKLLGVGSLHPANRHMRLASVALQVAARQRKNSSRV